MTGLPARSIDHVGITIMLGNSWHAKGEGWNERGKDKNPNVGCKLACADMCAQPACEGMEYKAQSLWYHEAHDRERACTRYICLTCWRKTTNGKTGRGQNSGNYKEAHSDRDTSSRTRSRRTRMPQRSICSRGYWKKIEAMEKMRGDMTEKSGVGDELARRGRSSIGTVTGTWSSCNTTRVPAKAQSSRQVCRHKGVT